MLGMIKAMPLLLVVAGGAYAYHTTTISKAEATIAQLEANNVILKENTSKLETALETETASREQAEQNLQLQLKAVGELTEKNTAMQEEMDDYLSIFKRHDLTRLARAKPGLVEPRINNGTKKVFEAIENDSVEVENADTN
jgi:hypothetical protein|tara:strand:- start:3656 stop:4078 length:423 start_codon:yes stop_codon:yes gene_type:complete